MTILRGKVVWEAHVENGEAIWQKGKFDVVEGQGLYISRQAQAHSPLHILHTFQKYWNILNELNY
jgi:hypothetical protein